MVDDDQISIEDATREFKVGRTKLYQWLREGRLKRYVREGDQRTFVSRRELAALRRFRELG